MDTLKLLAKLVSINSIFPNEQKIVTYLIDYLKELGFEVTTVETEVERLNIVATYGKSKSYLAFYSHSDTVPVYRGWITDPFKLTIKNDKAYGLGTGDMKGGMVAILKAGEFAVKNNIPVQIVIGVDEENISAGAHDLIRTRALKNIGCIMSAESGQVRDLKKPYSVVYGRLGREMFDIKVIGESAHAAEPHKGQNAIHYALELVQYLENEKLPSENNLGPARLLLQSIEAKVEAYSVPDSCLLQYSLLTNSKMASHKFINLFKKLMNKLKIKGTITLSPRPTPYGPCYQLDRKISFIKKIEKEIFNKDNITPAYAQSVADETIFANHLKIPVIVAGPIEDNIHKAQEWVSISSVNNLIEVYKKMLQIYYKSA